MPSNPPSRSPALPAWYHRVLDKDTVKPEDFDEDLSEQHTDVSSDEEDRTSTREGPEFDYYYELKGERDNRKEDYAIEKMKKKATRIEVQKSNRVKQVLIRIKKEEAENPKKPYEKEDMFVRGKRFGLYSVDFVKYGYTGDSADKMPKDVEFYHYPDVIYGPMPKSFRLPWYDDGELEGHVDIDGEQHHFQDLKSTRRGGLKKWTVKTTKGEKLVFQFLDSNHLTLRMSRDLAFADPRPGEDAAPKTFVFYGIAEGEATGTPDMWDDEDADSDYGYGWY